MRTNNTGINLCTYSLIRLSDTVIKLYSGKAEQQLNVISFAIPHVISSAIFETAETLSIKSQQLFTSYTLCIVLIKPVYPVLPGSLM